MVQVFIIILSLPYYRHARTKEHPATPQKHLKYSRRAWDGLIKVWRKKLHCFDPNGDSST